ncbi:MAG: hypothetical protein U1E42_05655 [Rhodospirillales bacterium]
MTPSSPSSVPSIRANVTVPFGLAFPDAEVLIHEAPYGIAERRAAFE